MDRRLNPPLKPGEFDGIFGGDEEVTKQLANLQKTVTCPICLGFLEDITVLTACGHIFCRECIVSSLLTKSACPFCKIPVNKNDYESWPQGKIEMHKILLLLQSFIGVAAAANIPNAEEDVSTTCRLPLFRIGDLVSVKPRCWPGINRQGGIARVLAVDNEEFTYAVRYVLDSCRDVDVPENFIDVPGDESGTRPRRDASKHHSGDSFSSVADINLTMGMSKRRRNDSVEGRTRIGGNNEDSLQSIETKRLRFTPIVLLCSSLEEDEKADVDAFAQKFNASISSRFDDTVTHLIVSVDEDNMFLQRTMKYMQSIMGGLWILGSPWVRNSLKVNRVVDEESFEVKGCNKSTRYFACRRARKAIAQIKTENCNYDLNSSCDATAMHTRREVHTQRLFEGFAVLLSGHFVSPGPPRSHFEDLLLRGGAQVTSELDTFLKFRVCGEEISNSSSSCSSMICYVVCTDTAAERNTANKIRSSPACALDADYFIFTQGQRKKVKHGGAVLNNRKISICFVNPMWVLQCVTDYQIIDAFSSMTYMVKDDLWSS